MKLLYSVVAYRHHESKQTHSVSFNFAILRYFSVLKSRAYCWWKWASSSEMSSF